MTEVNDVATPDENELIAVRREKLANWRESTTAYPNTFKRDVLAACLLGKYEAASEAVLAEVSTTFHLAGRIMTRRIMGKASFITFQDMSGKMQAYLRRDDLPEGQYNEFKKWDLGDIVGLSGTLFKTKTGELTVKVSQIELLTKALRPLPDKFHGLADEEMRARQRYVDLMVNERTREVFRIRSQTVSAVRTFLTTEKFIEVETPMMQVIPGGATARPFITHHNTLDMQLYMRVSPELYLKRLVVGGFERVFEINRNFRNEGISTRHNPEFTMIEYYMAYADYRDQMQLTEKLLRHVVETVFGKLSFDYQGEHYDFSQPFQQLSVRDSIKQYNPDITDAQLDDKVALADIAKKLDIGVDSTWGLGKLQIEVFEKTVEHRLLQPTFITEYPAEVSPLARCNDDDSFITDRFELFIAGRELANGFSELNDPEDQARRFQAQVDAKDAGDDEAMHFDQDYIRALEYGMPPTAGVGIGIDRLVMLLTDAASIREVILFPLLRPE